MQGQYCYIWKRCTSLQKMRLLPTPLHVFLSPFNHPTPPHPSPPLHCPPPPRPPSLSSLPLSPSPFSSLLASLASRLPPFLFSYFLSLFIAVTSEISPRVSPRATRNTSKDAYCSRQTGQNQVYRTFLRTLQGKSSTASYNTLFRI